METVTSPFAGDILCILCIYKYYSTFSVCYCICIALRTAVPTIQPMILEAAELLDRRGMLRRKNVVVVVVGTDNKITLKRDTHVNLQTIRQSLLLCRHHDSGTWHRAQSSAQPQNITMLQSLSILSIIYQINL